MSNDLEIYSPSLHFTLHENLFNICISDLLLQQPNFMMIMPLSFWTPRRLKSIMMTLNMNGTPWDHDNDDWINKYENYISKQSRPGRLLTSHILLRYRIHTLTLLLTIDSFNYELSFCSLIGSIFDLWHNASNVKRPTPTVATLCNVSHDNMTENTRDMRMLYGIVNHKEAYEQYSWYDSNSNSDVSASNKVIQTLN